MPAMRLGKVVENMETGHTSQKPIQYDGITCIRIDNLEKVTFNACEQPCLAPSVLKFTPWNQMSDDLWQVKMRTAKVAL